MKRRAFIRNSMVIASIGAAINMGMLIPKTVLAAWPKASFSTKSFDDALQGLFGSHILQKSSAISIKAPDIAENGAVVPITVSTKISGPESLAILIENNPTPLAAAFTLAPGTQGYISTRVKMGKTSPVTVVVKAGGKLYSNSKKVKVTIGGCGG